MSKVTMAAIACLPGGALILLAMWLWNREPEELVSRSWLSNQERYEGTRGQDGIAWRWPRTSADDDGLFNRFIERWR